MHRYTDTRTYGCKDTRTYGCKDTLIQGFNLNGNIDTRTQENKHTSI